MTELTQSIAFIQGAGNLLFAFSLSFYISYVARLLIFKKERKEVVELNEKLNILRRKAVKTLEEQKAFIDITQPKTSFSLSMEKLYFSLCFSLIVVCYLVYFFFNFFPLWARFLCLASVFFVMLCSKSFDTPKMFIISLFNFFVFLMSSQAILIIFEKYNIHIPLWASIIILILIPFILNYFLRKFGIEKNDILKIFLGGGNKVIVDNKIIEDKVNILEHKDDISQNIGEHK